MNSGETGDRARVSRARSGSRIPVALLLGAAAWLVQPLYVVAELAAAAASAAPYSVRDQTISDLGATTCTNIDYPYGLVEVCSPWHALVNGSFIGFGILMAMGAILLRGVLPRSRWVTASTVMWFIAGLSNVATGLVPVDQSLEGHSVAALPSLLAMPGGLLLLGVGLRRPMPRMAAVTGGVGLVSLAGAVLFIVTATSPEMGGVWERVAYWPTYLWLPVVAAALLRGGRSTPREESRESS